MIQVQRLEPLVRDHPGIADAQSELDVAFGPALWNDDLREDDPRTGQAPQLTQLVALPADAAVRGFGRTASAVSGPTSAVRATHRLVRGDRGVRGVRPWKSHVRRSGE